MSHFRAIHAATMAAAALTLSGCAQTNPPLMFGDTTTFGLRLGNDTASAGAAVSLGYKAYSIAMVPVSILDRNGHPAILRGTDEGSEKTGQADAMSVFAAFDNTSSASVAAAVPASGGSVHIGQVFSTGLAAQTLTFAICKKALSSACGAAPQAASAPASRTDVATGKSESAKSGTRVSVAGPGADAGAAAASTDQPYQKPLLFMRSDVIGIDIGGSLAQQGLQFVLGYGNRNMALIPVAAMGADQQVVPIVGNDVSADGRKLDTLSVMGQFNANSETARLNVGMDRYFATGVAARNLSNAMLVAVAGTTASEPPVAAGSAAHAAPVADGVASGARPGTAAADATAAAVASR